MRHKRSSMLLFLAERFAGRASRVLAGSAILGGLSKGYLKIEDAQTERGNGIRPSKISLHCLSARERSFLLGALAKLGRFFLASSQSSYGGFLMLYGAFSLLGGFFLDGFFHDVNSWALPLLSVILAVPLLTSSKSLGFSVRNSFFIGRFLFEFCGLSEEEIEIAEEGRGHLVLFSLFAALFALFRLLLTSYLPLLMGVLFLILLFILAVPEILMLGILVLFPFLSLLPHPTVTLLCLLLLLFLAWGWKTLCGKRALELSLCDGLILSFGVLYLLCGLADGSRYGSLTGGALIFLLILSYLPFQSMLFRPVWRRRAVVALALGGLFCSTLGVWQYFFTEQELRWVDASRFFDIGGRVTATFSNPNVLAVYLLGVLPFSFSGLFKEQNSVRMRLFFSAAFLMELLCLVLTWTRGAWLGAICAIFFFLLLYNRQSRGWLLLLPAFLLPTLPLLPANVLHRFSSIGMLTDSSIRYRLYTWRGTLRMISQHPWGVGIGERAFGSIYPHFAVSGTENVMHTHQIFLQLLTEVGISGLVMFLLILVCLFLSVLYGATHLEASARGELLGGGCGILGVLVMGLFDHVWYHRGMLALFWILAAFVSAPLVEGKYKRREWN